MCPYAQNFPPSSPVAFTSPFPSFFCSTVGLLPSHVAFTLPFSSFSFAQRYIRLLPSPVAFTFPFPSVFIVPQQLPIDNRIADYCSPFSFFSYYQVLYFLLLNRTYIFYRVHCSSKSCSIYFPFSFLFFLNRTSFVKSGSIYPPFSFFFFCSNRTSVRTSFT